MKFSQELAQAVSCAFFAWYGASCFLSRKMIQEFNRYQLPQARVLTGILQILASIGLIIGHFYRPILLISASGLALMMFLAVITRLKIRDPFWLAIPALSLCALNLFIAAAALSAP